MPEIKEPSYFFKAEESNSETLDSILSPGNLHRGIQWYRSLFNKIDNNTILVDMSTQYWLYPENVIRNVRESFDPVFIVFNRNKRDQLVSYISHLRRGHIGKNGIEEICDSDVELSEYLDRMAKWNEDVKKLAKKYPDLQIINIDFEEFTMNPGGVIGNIFPNVDGIEALDFRVHKNKKSYPRFHAINKIIFSRMARNIGRLMPQFLYSKLVKIRKRMVRLNLREGRGAYFDEDSKFINEKYK